ncbi:craniofacial development protein 2-like [Aphis craccivora]|uniref:Craniofacial development protein 2-like n=1 Tax=Aphis craccivora TaxID=307492 RepID=A0A6G0YDW7_APHCR|nr:craniofacial development protein 2-like [Aphis craccivora]
MEYQNSEINRYSVDIVRLQEIRWPGSGNLKSENMTVFFSGKNNGNTRMGLSSVSRLVKKFEPINDRICYIVLTEKTFDTVIVNCYAPTETADCELKDLFYDDLDRVLENIPRESIKIVVGDFNAQVGWENIIKPIVGKESLHQESNNNGMRLISLCTDKGLIKSSINSVRSYRGADGNTDHYLKEITAYHNNLINILESNKPDTEPDIEKGWNIIKEAVNKAAYLFKKKTQTRDKPWFDDECRDVIEK